MKNVFASIFTATLIAFIVAGAARTGYVLASPPSSESGYPRGSYENPMRVEPRFKPWASSAGASTTVVKASSGFLHTLTVMGGTAGVIRIYNSATTTAGLVVDFASTNALATYTFDVEVTAGIVVVKGAATNILLSWR